MVEVYCSPQLVDSIGLIVAECNQSHKYKGASIYLLTMGITARSLIERPDKGKRLRHSIFEI